MQRTLSATQTPGAAPANPALVIRGSARTTAGVADKKNSGKKKGIVLRRMNKQIKGDFRIPKEAR